VTHPTAKYIRLIAWSLVLLANIAIAEGIAGMYYRHSKGHWIWNRTPPAADQGSAPAGEDPVRTKMVLDPYFGSNTVKGLRFDTQWEDDFYKKRITGLDYLPSYYRKLGVNSHGFWSFHEYPYHPANDEFVIGVFGGSVAFHFWLSSLDEKTGTLKKLAQTTGKRLVVLNFASGGRKQPELLLELSYFLAIGQHFDFILNIDGFNEAYVSWLNTDKYKTNFSMPFAEFVYKIQNSFAERVQAAASGGWSDDLLFSSRDQARKWIQEAHFALPYYAAVLTEKLLSAKVTAREITLAKLRDDVRYPVQLVRDPRTYEQIVPELTSVWFNSSVSMANLAKGAGVPYLHVLQPNQYFSKKTLSSQETAWQVRGPTEVPLATLVPAAYKSFLHAATQFSKHGVAFIDATPVFDNVSDTVFIDWCCHVNERGDAILNDLIQPKMIEMLPSSAPGRRPTAVR
jgi:hypothetical protein